MPLNDPDREEWQTDYEPILADSLEQAQKLCQKLAEERGLELLEIKQPSRKKGKLYVCKFGGFVERQESTENP